jgi:hypothetical protein
MDRPTEARRRLAKATNWLDRQDSWMPPETSTMGLHLHNWIEAQVLRREVEARLQQAGRGEGAALSEDERAYLRKQVCDLLTTNLAAWGVVPDEELVPTLNPTTSAVLRRARQGCPPS